MEPGNSSSYDSSSSYEYDLSDAFKHPIQIEIFISIFVWSVTSCTIIGNTLVLASFTKDARLRAKVGNMFLLNLASADLLVGLNSLPFNNLWRYYGNWPFGEPFCKLFLLLDYTATLQSTFAIMLISLDRYLMVTLEVTYITFMTHRKAVFGILLTWCAAFVFFAVPILGYDHWEGSWVNYSVTCDMAVFYSLSYNIITLIFAFALPGVLLVYFNLMVFMNIRKRSHGLVRSRQVAPSDVSTISTTADPLHDYRQTLPRVDLDREENGRENVVHNQVKSDTRRELKRDKKAAITLAMIVTVYVICWLPYYITQLIYVAYEKEYTISWRVWMTVYYLVWLNSALNPCLYAIASPKMRGNFYDLLCCWKRACKS